MSSNAVDDRGLISIIVLIFVSHDWSLDHGLETKYADICTSTISTHHDWCRSISSTVAVKITGNDSHFAAVTTECSVWWSTDRQNSNASNTPSILLLFPDSSGCDNNSVRLNNNLLFCSHVFFFWSVSAWRLGGSCCLSPHVLLVDLAPGSYTSRAARRQFLVWVLWHLQILLSALVLIRGLL